MKIILVVIVLWGAFTLIFSLLTLLFLREVKNKKRISEIEGFFTWVFENFEYDLNSDVWLAKTGIIRKRLEELYKIYFENVKKC